MRAAVYYSNDDVRVERVERPTPGAGELLMRIHASGVCGSDVMEWYRKAKAPLVLGHEVSGTVEEVGPGITGFATGDRIVATHHVPCNTCDHCLTDRHSVCETLHTTTFDPGGFCEFVRLPAINVDRGVFHLTEQVSFEEATFVEPLACVIRGQRLAGLRPGDTVAVLGSGISGILQIKLARAMGAGAIIATDTSEYRVAAACGFGADLALQADTDLTRRVREFNRGRLADRVIVCAGAKPAMEQALQLVERGGTVLFFAPLAPGETLAMPVNDLWKRGITITHSYAGPPADMRSALELIAARRVEVGDMITHRLGLDETQEGFRLTAAAGESMKVVIDPRR
jgi:L-iditol 2-dehydrogenase